LEGILEQFVTVKSESFENEGTGMMKTILLIGIILIGLFPGLVMAHHGDDHSDIDALLELELEELTVSVASKREEKISEAPSIVTVVTAEDIQRFGGQTLFDVLGRLPNVYTFGSSVFPDNVVSIRGGNLTHINNSILILLNGRPMRESFGGGVNNSVIYRSFPLEIIERIEMIRGPGSVLYGSNAFTGVINIISKKTSDVEGKQVSVGYGSFGTRQVSATYGGSFLDGELEVIVSGKATNDEGDNLRFTDSNGTSGFLNREADNHGTFAQVRYGGLTVMGFDGYESLEGLPNSVTFPTLDRAKTRRRFIDAGYEQPLGSGWNANFNITHNIHEDADESQLQWARDTLFEVSASGPLWDDVHLLVGGASDNHEVRLDVDTADSDTWYSAYAQTDFKATDWLKFVLGIQMNKPKGSDRDFSPRAGVIVTPHPNWGAKLLYGEAFRSPFAAERAVNAPPAIVGNPDLEPETIQTTDLQFFYNDQTYQAALTLYRSIQDNTIVREGVGPATFANGGKIDYKGIEFEGDITINDQWAVNGSVSWQGGEDSAGNNDVGLVPHYMAKIGVSYQSDHGYDVGVHNSYFSAAARLEESRSGVAVNNPSAGSFNWLTLNMNVDVNQVMGLYTIPDTTFTLHGSNLLNEDVFFPETARGVVNTTPQRSGRAIFGYLTVKF
jgi:outer membrane receptor for ferrienterochelin and colicins